jgi:hypothetical protein
MEGKAPVTDEECNCTAIHDEQCLSSRIDELKPCPFCGAPAERFEQGATEDQMSNGFGEASYGVRCTRSGFCEATIDGFRAENVATIAWNRRSRK